ncbi:hypothetical protein BH24ACT16_BH24ACT16_16190 [soil metagenome]
MTDKDTTIGWIDSTISALREGAMQLALDRGRKEVSGWQRMLQDSGEQQLIPISDNLAALDTALSLDPLDGATIGRLMRTLAGQTREVASGDLLGGSAAPVAERLESLAGLLENEGASISDVG